MLINGLIKSLINSKASDDPTWRTAATQPPDDDDQWLVATNMVSLLLAPASPNSTKKRMLSPGDMRHTVQGHSDLPQSIYADYRGCCHDHAGSTFPRHRSVRTPVRGAKESMHDAESCVAPGGVPTYRVAARPRRKELLTVHARSTAGPGKPFTATTIERRDPGPHDVLIDIAYCGVCHSDIHSARGDWDFIVFPLVPGHEITGIVSAVGSEVTRFAVGDRAGVGCLVDSCRACDRCAAGEEQYCGAVAWTYSGVGPDGRTTDGGYSEKIVVDENYTLRIPDGLDLDRAAPLLCAGVTLYSPLRRWGAGPGKRVAILGLGGLGHLGVKLAHAMGAEVTVLSRSQAKLADSRRLGADHHYPLTEPTATATLAGAFDLVISTRAADLDLNADLSLLRCGGVFLNLGMPNETLAFTPGVLNGARRIVAGSMIGGIAATQETLDFCATNNIGADIELITADEIDKAYDRAVAGDVRYRFVVDGSTLRP
jgi:alcohol dehydrogenase (NADP+)